MSSKRSAAAKVPSIDHTLEHNELCDDLFTWSEVDRKNTISIEEAASLLGIEIAAAEQFIADGTLCATKDDATESWLVKLACVRAQLADCADQDTVDDAAERATAANTAPMPAKEPFSRSAVTKKNIEALMDSLDFANVRLEGSFYRIGYLEAQVASLQEQLKVLPEFRQRAAEAILKDRENDILREEIDKQKKRNEEMLEGNTRLATQLTEMDTELERLHASIDELERTWWWPIFSWLFGFCFRPQERRNSSGE